MAWGKTPEEKERAAEAELDRRERAARVVSPADRARAAFARGDILFQVALDLQDEDGSERDPNQVLNAIDEEGWDLHSTGFVFVQEEGTVHDRSFGSEQRVSVHGRVVGYYVFQRRDDEDDED